MPFTPPPPESGVAPDDQAFTPPPPESGIPAGDQPWYKRLGQTALGIPAITPTPEQKQATYEDLKKFGQDYYGPQGRPSELSDLWKASTTSPINPQAPFGIGKAVQGASDFLAAGISPEVNAPAWVRGVGGVMKGGLEAAEGFPTPANLALTGGVLTRSPAALKSILSGAFAVLGIKQAGEAAGPFGEAIKNGDWGKAGEEGVKILLGGGQAYLGARGVREQVNYYRDLWNKEADQAESSWESKKTPDTNEQGVKSEIAKARKEGPSPEFRSFFGGIDPVTAGTTPEAVAAYAKSLGMEWRPAQPPTAPTSPPTPTTQPSPTAPAGGVELSPGLEAIAQKVADPNAGQLTPDENKIISSITPQQRKIYLARVDALRKGGEQNASQNKETAEVHGDVRPQPGQSQGAVPVQESGPGVQPSQTQTQVTAPVIPGVRFDKVVPGATGKPSRWTYTIQNNGPAHNAQISIEQGATPAQIEAKIIAKESEYLPSAQDVAKMTTDEFKDFRKQVQYGPRIHEAIGSKITAEQRPDLEKARDRLRKEAADELSTFENSKGMDMAAWERSQWKANQAQVLEESLNKSKPSAAAEAQFTPEEKKDLDALLKSHDHMQGLLFQAKTNPDEADNPLITGGIEVADSRMQEILNRQSPETRKRFELEIGKRLESNRALGSSEATTLSPSKAILGRLRGRVTRATAEGILGPQIPRHKFLTDIWGDKEPNSEKDTGWQLRTEKLKSEGINPAEADKIIGDALAAGADPAKVEALMKGRKTTPNVARRILTGVQRLVPKARSGAPLKNIPAPNQVVGYQRENPRGLGRARPPIGAPVNDPVIEQHRQTLIAGGNSQKTIDNYVGGLNAFHNWYLGEYGTSPNWTEVTQDNLRDYLLYLSLKQYSTGSKLVKFSALSSLFNNKNVMGNKRSPVEGIKLPKPDDKVPKVITVNEAAKLMSAPAAYWSKAVGPTGKKALRDIAGVRDKAIIETIYSTGLRMQELTQLKVQDINFDDQLIRVTGKGNKERIVPINPRSLNDIRNYWQKSGRTPGPSEFVFTGRDGRQPLTTKQFDLNFKKYLREVGMSQTFTPHDMRHAYATHMLNNGANIRDIQELLGHKSIKTTQIYTHVSLQNVRAAHSKAFDENHPSNQSPTPTNPQITPDFEGPGTAAPAGFTPKDPEIKQLADSVSTLVASNRGKPELREAYSLGERLSRAKEKWLKALTGLRGAGLASLDALRGKPIVTTWKNALGNHDVAMTESTLNNRDYRKQMTKAVPIMVRRGGISVRLGVGDDDQLLELMEQQAPARYRKYFMAARSLTPEEMVIVNNHRNYFEARFDEAYNAGILKNAVENYLHRIYPNDERFIDKIVNELGSGIYTGRPGLAKKRIYRTDLDAILAGLHPEMDFTVRVAAYDHALNKAFADRKLIQDFWEIKEKDGRPMLDVGGKADEVEGAEEGDPATLLVNPHWKRGIDNDPVDTPEVREKKRLNYRGDYKVVNWAPLRGWRWVDTDENGKKTLVQGDVLVHKDAVERIEALFKPSAVRQAKLGGVPVGRAALGLSTNIKQIAFDLSMFHPVQLTVHGAEHRVFEPYFKWIATGLGMEITKIDMNDPITRGLVHGGLMLADHSHLQLFQEGLGGSLLTRYIPFGIGRLAQAYQYGLFHDWIPRLKLKMAKHALERNKENFPELTQAELYELTANQSNSAFGELNWRRMGISRTTQDMLRLGMIAPDFTLARGKYAGQALQTLIPRQIPPHTGPGGATSGGGWGFGFGREQAVAMIFYGAFLNYILARILNKWINGSYHFEPSNAFSVIYKGKAYSLRTAHGDLLHLATDTSGFFYNRLNPFFGATAIEYVTGRDQFGRHRTNMEQLQDLATRAGVPISLRGFLHPREQSLWESFANMMGITNHRSTSIDNIYRLAENFKKVNNIAEPAERIYNADRDPYRGIKLAALYRSPEEVAIEIDRAFKARQSDPERLRAHFKEYATRPFSGSKKLEENFYNQLSEDEKGIYKEAWQERLKMIDNLEKGGELYEQMKTGQPTGTKFIPPPAGSGVPP
jgi:integrase/recombinase XerC